MFFGEETGFSSKVSARSWKWCLNLPHHLDSLIFHPFYLVFFQFQALKASFSSPKSGKGGNFFGAAKGARICPRPSALCGLKKSTNHEIHRNPMFFCCCVFHENQKPYMHIYIYPKTSWGSAYLRHFLLVTTPWLPTSIHRLYTCCALFLNEVKSKGVLLVSCPQSFQEWYTDKLKAGWLRCKASASWVNPVLRHVERATPNRPQICTSALQALSNEMLLKSLVSALINLSETSLALLGKVRNVRKEWTQCHTSRCSSLQ